MNTYIQLISKYRSELMGFAILWICIFHTNLAFQNSYLNTVRSLGYSGVDIFLFISGFGLFYSFKKNDNVRSFYKKRLLKILPTYWIFILIVHLLHQDYSIFTLIVQFSTLGFWFPIFAHPFFEWYVPSLLAFYLVFPLFMSYFKKNKEKALLIAILLGLFLTLVLVIIQKGTIILFTSRIPIFFLGVYFGYLSQNSFINNRTGKVIIYFMQFITIIVLIVQIRLINYYDEVFLWRSSLYWTPFALIIPGLCVGIAKSFDILKNLNFIYMNKFFSFLGGLSFEIYLIHYQLFGLNKNLCKYLNISSISGFILLFFASIVLAQLFSKIMGYIKQLFFSKCSN